MENPNGDQLAARARTFARIGSELREIRREIRAIVVRLDAIELGPEPCLAGARAMVTAELARQSNHVELLIKHARTHERHPEAVDMDASEEDDEEITPALAARLATLFGVGGEGGEETPGAIFSIVRNGAKRHD